MFSNKELRDQLRRRKVEALFKERHAKYPTHDHTASDPQPSVGEYHREQCRSCGLIVNYLESDLK